jgi:hypothetical protein
VLRSFRSHLNGYEHGRDGYDRRSYDDIPLNAMYTRVDTSSNFTTSAGLNPNDIAVCLRRAEAQL